jgi:SAM-dependent methyltransferase
VSVSPDELKQRQRAMWAAGDYPDIAATVADVAELLVAESGVAEGETLLDVATGHGSAALAAARRGARVTGIDLTPELVAIARERAVQEGLEIQFDEGDAEHLPYDDDQFDNVVSSFGAMFAPDQERTAAELLRVCRPGGTIVISAWTPEGLNGQMVATLGRHLPPPPEGFKPPTLWGADDHVRKLFASASDVRSERRRAPNNGRAESIDAWLDYLERVLGPVVLAKAMLEPQGKWSEARSDLAGLYERFNEADDGSMRAQPEYLLSVVSP